MTPEQGLERRFLDATARVVLGLEPARILAICEALGAGGHLLVRASGPFRDVAVQYADGRVDELGSINVETLPAEEADA